MTLREQLQSALSTTYDIQRELGGGGMSRVFVAHERALDREVVVKVLPPELAATVSAERFAREVHVAAKLQHPNIVPVHSAGDAAGVPYFTMPLIHGESLADRLARGPVPLAEAVSILRDVARALAYAHEHGIVHRDVKPQNILITGGLAVVTDFGIAKAIALSKTAGDLAAPSLTATGSGLGTPAYIAPEQAVGDTVDRRADIYSWGIVAYELLTGANPFSHRTTAQQLVSAHIAEHPAPILEKRRDLPPALAQLVMRCLEKNPTDRPQSAGGVVSALGDVWTQSGPVSGPARWSSRTRVLWSGGVAIVAVAAVAFAFALARWRSGSGMTPSLAVLPFSSEGDTADVYFAEGLADELQRAFSKVPGLQLVPRTRAKAAARNAAGDARAAGKALGVSSVLEGAIRRGRGPMRVTITLTRVSDGIVLWNATGLHDEAEVFAIQNALEDSILTALNLRSSGVRANVTGTKDLVALNLYRRAAHMWPDRYRLDEAARLLDSAVARDSNYADAYALLANVWAALPAPGAPR
jgi:serine/threonine-protein kinase